MPEPITTTVTETSTPETTTVHSQETQPKPEIKPDLLTRVSQFKKPETTTEPKKDGEVDFDFKELENIKTPEEAKTYAEKAYKSMQSGWNKKFQEVAELRKTLEKQMQDFTDWSPEKIQKLLNDPKFVSAAQQVAQTKAPPTYQGTDQEWSNLSEQEKVKFKQMEDELHQLKQQNFQAEIKRQDERLKERYANYAPDIVDTAMADMGKLNAASIREHVFKAVDYEDMAKRAYELGRQDERQSKQEKIQSVSIDGSNVNQNSEKIVPEQGEKDQQFLKRLFLRNLSLYGNKK